MDGVVRGERKSVQVVVGGQGQELGQLAVVAQLVQQGDGLGDTCGTRHLRDVTQLAGQVQQRTFQQREIDLRAIGQV